ncbi:MAG: hypothetical protein GMKNLPBB_00979 [Myxococcota bacterium]|nr:hypothetical protein [Myxococcota bacterium]
MIHPAPALWAPRVESYEMESSGAQSAKCMGYPFTPITPAAHSGTPARQFAIQRQSGKRAKSPREPVEYGRRLAPPVI